MAMMAPVTPAAMASSRHSRRTTCQTMPTAGVIFVSSTGVHHAADRWMARTAKSAMNVLMFPRRTSSFSPGTIRNQPARSQARAATCMAVQIPRNTSNGSALIGAIAQRKAGE